MNLRYLVAWLLLITLAPLVLLQAYRLRRTAIRLPPAQGPRHGSVPAAGAELRVLLMGESTVAGVGARNHQEALSGQLAAAIHGLSARSVVRAAAGLNGRVARETADRAVPGV